MPRKSAFKCYFGCIPYKGKVHHFPPQEYPYFDKFQQWKKVLNEIDKNRGDKYIINNIRICDHHFEDFYKTASGRLTKNAVPTLNIASTSSLELILPIFEGTPATIEHDSVMEASTTSAEAIMPICKGSSVPYVSLKKSNASVNVVKNRSLKLQSQLKVKLLKLREKCKTLNQKLKVAAKIAQNQAFLRAVEKLPEPAAIFTTRQLKKTHIKPRGRRYTNKEKVLCLTIYKQSQKAYKLMQRLMALPSIKTVKKFLSKVNIKPEINEVVIQHLKKVARKLPKEKRICTLIFDEVALNPGLYYNKGWDQIIGFEDFGTHNTNKIADHALVFMVKGLKGKYKQPIIMFYVLSECN